MAPPRKTLDEPPEPDEVEEVLQRVLAEGAPPKPDEPPAGAKPEEIGAPTPAGEAAVPGTGAEATPGYFEVDGRRFTPEDIRDLQAGSMRREEYDRSIEDLRREQGYLAEQIDRIRERKASEQRLGKKGRTDEDFLETGEGGEGAEGREEENATDRRLRELTEQFQGIQREMAEERMRGVNRHAVQVFERTVDRLMDTFKVPDDPTVRGWLHRQTMAMDPAYIENGRLLSDMDIARNTRKAFDSVFGEWRDYNKAQRDRLVAEMRAAGTKLVPPGPAGGPAPTPALVAKREPTGMRPAEDAQEFMGILAARGLKP